MSLQDSHQIGDVKVMLKVGADGKGISSIEKTGTAGIVDTYTITFTDGSKTTFEITNGSSIESIEKTQTVGLVDTYTITLTNGETSTFTVTNGEGGGLLPHVIVISETGSVVTLTKGTDVITAVETSTGHFETDVPEYGTWVIDAIFEGDDAQVSLVVDACKVYVVDDTHFHADITVNYPSGSTCNLSGGSESYYATGSPYTFTVHHADTYTITVVYDGQTYTGQVEVTTSGTSFNITVPAVEDAPINDINLWLMYGGVSGSYSSLDDILADSSALATLMATQDAVDYLVRCTGWAGIGFIPVMTSDTTPSGECSAISVFGSSYQSWKAFDASPLDYWCSQQTASTSAWIQYKFDTPQKVKKAYIQTFNTADAKTLSSFTISGSNDGTNFTPLKTVSVGAVLYDNTVDIENNDSYLYYRVTLTGDSANKYYYMRQIQLYSENICDDSSAMTYIGLNNYASNTLLADATWLNAIANSTYFESVLNSKVPTMTSSTTPSGECFSTIRPEMAYRVFNGDEGTGSSSYWYMSSTDGTILGSYIGYMFTASNMVKLLKFLSKSMSGYVRKSCNFTLQGSNDNSTWTDIGDFSDTGTDSKQSFMFSLNATLYTYYRIVCKSANGNMTYNSSLNMLLITELQFYGREDV